MINSTVPSAAQFASGGALVSSSAALDSSLLLQLSFFVASCSVEGHGMVPHEEGGARKGGVDGQLHLLKNMTAYNVPSSLADSSSHALAWSPHYCCLV